MREFFGGKFIEKEKLEEAGIYYPIKLEYYKQINNDIEVIRDRKPKYGIIVIKTTYIPNNTIVEGKEVDFISDDEGKIEKILRTFKENEVTPICVEEILVEMSKARC